MVQASLTALARSKLVDTFGRVHRSMRISITDKCQLRCTYCMPAEGLLWMKQSALLTPNEIFEIARIAYSAGFREFRITGGEPLIRPDIQDIIRRLSSLSTPEDPVDISMTTNAVLLDRFAGPLRNAGLGRLNVSLDTLDPKRYKELTLRDDIDKVFLGLRAARSAGIERIKINTLLIPGVNDDEVLPLAAFALKNDFELRFIEQMPLGHAKWDSSSIITQADILSELSARYTLTKLPGRGSAPAARWQLNEGPGTVGIIASVTNPFCKDCDRLRLSADGKLRTCLFSDVETDLATPLRAGATDEELLEIMSRATLEKGAGHAIGKAAYVRPKKGMSQIGG